MVLGTQGYSVSSVCHWMDINDIQKDEKVLSSMSGGLDSRGTAIGCAQVLPCSADAFKAPSPPNGIHQHSCVGRQEIGMRSKIQCAVVPSVLLAPHHRRVVVVVTHPVIVYAVG